MHIIEVAPLQRIPRPAQQLLTYLSPQKIEPGALLKVPLRNKLIWAVVFDCRDFDKQEIKNAGFILKQIPQTDLTKALFARWQLKLSFWLAEYYFTSPGIFLKMMLPVSQISKKFAQMATATKASSQSQELVIMPTLADLENFKKSDFTIVNSSLKNSELKKIWLDVKSGKITKIAGTKITAFLPFCNLKKITVLKESNAHHRSWDQSPHWQVHEVVCQLEKIFSANLIFKSILPSVESFYRNKQKLLKLDYRFPQNNPVVKIIDQRQEVKHQNASVFSRSLQGAILNNLKKKKQVILFNLRRGAATFILCRHCGYTVLCPNCEVSLVAHKTIKQNGGIWLCHHCGFSETPDRKCPECGSDQIKEFGTGSQKVEAGAKVLWPQARITRLDSDSAPSLESQKEIIKNFNRGQIDILISTQIIFTHPVKPVNLAGIISADTVLNLPDFRSSERLFKIISLMKNLTKNEKSFLLIQTFNTEDRTLKLASIGKYEKFYKEELEARKVLDYPPFFQIIKATSKNKSPQKAIEILKTTASKLREIQNTEKLNHFEIFGPLPAFIPKERGQYIYNLIIKFRPLQETGAITAKDLFLRNEFLKYIPSNVFIDVDPESIL